MYTDNEHGALSNIIGREGASGFLGSEERKNTNQNERESLLRRRQWEAQFCFSH